ncbi:MAG: Fpg/Nei family DNA glycosylase [Desulfococcaceae bacterium]
MPELPDVEVFRQYFKQTALHQAVTAVAVEDERVLGDVRPEDVSTAAKGRSFIDARRHGKHLFAQLSDGGWIMFHFGMTGFFKYFKKEEAAPEHPRVIFEFENDYRLAWDCQRMIGEVALVENPETFISEKDLGPDALEILKEVFLERLAGKRGMIKTALMDQSLLAGVGNVYSDDILFQCRLHPKTAVGDLSESDRERIFDAMGNVLQTAISAKVDPAEMPDRLLTAHRGRDNQCPNCGGELEKIKVSGRNGWNCPRCQRPN